MNKVSREANRVRWEEHVNTWKSSGLSQSAYCRKYGLLPKLLSAWVGRVKRDGAKYARETVEAARPLKRVPIVIQDFGEHGKLNLPIHLQHPIGWQWQLPRDVSAGWVGNVLRELA